MELLVGCIIIGLMLWSFIEQAYQDSQRKAREKAFRARYAHVRDMMKNLK